MFRAIRVPRRVSLLVVMVLLTFGCGGTSTPTGPSLSSAAGGNVGSLTTAIATPRADDLPPPLTIEEVAPVLAEMLTAVTEDGLRQGSTQSGPGRWVYACPAGGTARIELPDTLPSAGSVAAVDTAVVWTECALIAPPTTAGSRPLAARSIPIVARGRLALRLRTWQFWHPIRGPIFSNPNDPIQIQGSLDVNEIGPVPITCSTSAASCSGTIGGITTGPPDTAPPPNPTPAPTPAPAPTFDGTYTGSADGTDTLTLTVTNGVVSFTVGSDVIPGTVSGSGAITASGGNCNATLAGQITLTSSGGATATGTWSHPATSGCGTANSGTWTATR